MQSPPERWLKRTLDGIETINNRVQRKQAMQHFHFHRGYPRSLIPFFGDPALAGKAVSPEGGVPTADPLLQFDFTGELGWIELQVDYSDVLSGMF
jgi:hypothetical protein